MAQPKDQVVVASMKRTHVAAVSMTRRDGTTPRLT